MLHCKKFVKALFLLGGKPLISRSYALVSSFLLYGMIGTSGIRILVDSKVDFSKSKNLILTSIIFVTGLSGVTINLGNVQLSGMILACIVGMILSLIFHMLDKFHLTNDEG